MKRFRSKIGGKERGQVEGKPKWKGDNSMIKSVQHLPSSRLRSSDISVSGYCDSKGKKINFKSEQETCQWMNAEVVSACRSPSSWQICYPLFSSHPTLIGKGVVEYKTSFWKDLDVVTLYPLCPKFAERSKTNTVLLMKHLRKQSGSVVHDVEHHFAKLESTKVDWEHCWET